MSGHAKVAKGEINLEAGGTLFPGLSPGENELHWGFIRKVYGIVTAQFLLTTIIIAVTVLHAPLNALLSENRGITIPFTILLFVLRSPLHHYQQKRPLNFVFLGLFTVCHSLFIDVICAMSEGRLVLEALILTFGIVLALDGYTFWASKKGKDQFIFLGPVLFSGLIVLIVTGFLQMFFPLGSTSIVINGSLIALSFALFLAYDRDDLIKRSTHYIWASIFLYFGIMNLFLAILNMLGGIQFD